MIDYVRRRGQPKEIGWGFDVAQMKAPRHRGGQAGVEGVVRRALRCWQRLLSTRLIGASGPVCIFLKLSVVAHTHTHTPTRACARCQFLPLCKTRGTGGANRFRLSTRPLVALLRCARSLSLPKSPCRSVTGAKTSFGATLCNKYLNTALMQNTVAKNSIQSFFKSKENKAKSLKSERKSLHFKSNPFLGLIIDR